VGYEAFTGCKFKDAAFCISWAQLLAASGLVAITYTNREPAADLQALIRHVRQNAASLGVDADSIGVWASSGNVPLALSLLMQADAGFLKGAVLCYGFTLDLDGSTAIAEAAATWKFANPGRGKSVMDLPRDLPLFVARAGRDEFPRLNDTLDRFLAHALACNLPLTLVNHPTGPHAFDLVDDSETSREIVRRILAFVRFHLLR
jgi:acetyl esterase/lipase